MHPLVILVALIPAVFAAGAASITGCGCSVSYTGGAPVTCFVTCTNTDANQAGTVSRTGGNSIIDSQAGILEFKWRGNFTNNCPTCMSSYGCGPQPTACWDLVRTDGPDVSVIGGCYSGGSPNPPTYQFMQGFSNIQPYVGYFPAGATFGVRLTISSTNNIGNCNANLAGFSVVVNHPAK